MVTPAVLFVALFFALLMGVAMTEAPPPPHPSERTWGLTAEMRGGGVVGGLLRW